MLNVRHSYRNRRSFSVCSLHSLCPYFLLFSESLWMRTERSSTTGSCGKSVAVYPKVQARHSHRTQKKNENPCCDVFNGRTDHHHQQRCLRFCLFLMRDIVETSSMFIDVRNFFFFGTAKLVFHNGSSEAYG